MQLTRCTKCMGKMEEGERICPNCGYEKNSGSQPPNALRRGTILRSRYYIGNVIGQGGFGITYVGWDLTLEMKVAVKEYFPSGSASRTNLYSNEIQWEFTDSGEVGWSEGLERFLKEARKMAKLDSIPAVVRVWDAFGENRTAYIVMDFVEGITLKKYLQTHGVLGYEECLNLLLPILDSLAVIHDRGLIHRDISPDNIMIQPDGSARLLDMGAAVDVRANDGLASMAVVKRNFSAPEQYMDSERLGSWTDVYAMAATMNYCITGRVVPEAMERELKKTSLYYDPGLNLPLHFKDALNSALALKAEERIRDMGTLKERLTDSDGSVGKQGRDLKGRRKITLIAVGALFAVCALTILFCTTRVSERAENAVAEATDGTVAEMSVHPAEPEYLDVSLSDLSYEKTEDEKGVILTRYMGEGNAYIKLPDEIDGQPVIELGSGIFRENETLEGIILPSGLETIKGSAFQLCVNLREMELPEGLRDIDGSAFAGIGLEEMTIPSTVETIRKGAYIFKVPRVKIAEGNKTYTMVDNMICKDNGELTAFPPSRKGEFVIPPEISVIGDYACFNTSLTAVTIPGSVRTVGANAFSGGTGLQKVVIENGVHEVKGWSFSDCRSLSEVIIPESVKIIGYWAFDGCDSLESVTVSRDCKMENGAFGEDVEIHYYD